MTASIGSGHDQAAETIKRSIMGVRENYEVEVIDFMNILHPTISQFIISTYLKMIDLFPSAYHFIYHITKRLSAQSKVSDLITYRYQKKIIKLLTSKKTDMIVFTNPFPTVLISSLKKKGKISTPCATIITDYTAHPVWLDDSIDMYFVGCQELKLDLINRGVIPSKIIVSGIPIHEKFDLPLDKSKIINEQEIKPMLPTLLVMGGGLGIGPIKEMLDIINEISSPLQLLVVAGKNQQLKRELEAKEYRSEHKVKIYGFCNNIHELMEISDLLISKSGGLTMTEAISKGLPTIIVDPIPGQEIVNAMHFSEIGAARLIEERGDLKGSIMELIFLSPEKLKEMRQISLAMAKPEAATNISKNIVQYLEKLDKKDWASIVK